MASKHYERITEPDVLQLIGRLSATGIPTGNIAREIETNFGFRPGNKIIENVVRGFSIRGSYFLETDKDIANIFKQGIIKLLTQSEKNVDLLANMRDKLKVISDNIENSLLLDDDGKRFLLILREIKDTIRTLDNSISTEKSVLELLDKQKKEVTVSTVQSMQQTMDNLEELEKEGMILINDRLKKKKNNLIASEV